MNKLLILLALLLTCTLPAQAGSLSLMGVGKPTAAAPPGTGPVVASSTQIVTTSGSTVTCVINKPTGTASGDLLVANYYAVAGTITGNTVPTGFTQVGTNSDVTTGLGVLSRAYLYTKLAGGSEPSTYSFSMTGTSPFVCGAVMLRVTGQNATPINVSVHAENATGAATQNFPTATTTVANTLLVRFGADFTFGGSPSSTDWPLTTPASYTMQQQATVGGGNIGVATIAQAASGAVGTLTVNTAGGGPVDWHGFTYAIQP